MSMSFAMRIALAALALLGAQSSGSAEDDLYGDPLPVGAVARFGTVRLRHAKAPMVLAFSNDGKTLASAGFDDAIRLWDVQSGKPLQRLRGDARWVSWLGFSADAKTLLSVGTGDGVCVWDVVTGKQQRIIASPVSGKPALAVSADHKLAAYPGPDGAVLLCDLGNGKEVRKLIGHKGFVGKAAFSNDGKMLASRASGDAVIRLWDVLKGEELRQIPMKLGETGPLVFSSNGELLATVGVQSPIRLFDTATGKETRQTEGQPIGSSVLAFAPNGRFLVSGGTDWRVRMWGAASGLELRQWAGHRTNVSALAICADSKLVASASFDQTVCIWDVAKNQEVHVFGGHLGSVTQAFFLDDGKRVASAGRDGHIRIWEASTGKEIDRSVEHFIQGPVRVSGDGKVIISRVGGSGSLLFWQPGAGHEFRRAKGDFKADESDFTSLSFGLANEGKHLVMEDVKTHNLHLINTTTHKTDHVLTGHKGYITQTLFTPDNKVLITSGMDKTTRLWDLSSGKEIRQLQPEETRNNSSNFLAISADSKTLAVLDWQVSVRFWEIATGQERAVYEKTVPRPTALAFSPNGRLLAEGHEDGTVVLREMTAFKERARWTGHQGRVLSLAFSADSRLVVSASSDCTALVWKVPKTAAAPPVELKREALSALWLDLARGDGRKAYRAVWSLAEASNAVPYLKDRILKTPVERKRIAKLIVDLDSDHFTVRETASHELAELERFAVPQLKEALGSKLPLEVQRRVEKLLAGWKDIAPVSEEVRQLRALEALEIIGTQEARDALKELSQKFSSTAAEQEARAILGRLKKRDAASP